MSSVILLLYVYVKLYSTSLLPRLSISYSRCMYCIIHARWVPHVIDGQNGRPYVTRVTSAVCLPASAISTHHTELNTNWSPAPESAPTVSSWMFQYYQTVLWATHKYYFTSIRNIKNCFNRYTKRNFCFVDYCGVLMICNLRTFMTFIFLPILLAILNYKWM
jgi:hypothetical protein